MEANCKDEIEVREEQISARVPSSLMDALRRIARQNDRALAAEVRQAIRGYIAEVDAERDKAAA
jgi:predicted DNA-binding protein